TITPALRAFKRTWPQSRVDVVVEARYTEVLEGHPDVDHVWPLRREARATFDLARRIRRERYDVAVDFFGNPRSAQLVWASRAPVRAGFDLRGRRHHYTITVPRHAAPPWGESEYAALPHLRLAAAVGAPAQDWRPAIQVSGAARGHAESLW